MLATLLKLSQKMAHRQNLPSSGADRRGFSLVEMMIIISIVGILATVSAPPVFRYVQSNRLQTNADRMAADLQYARAVSIANSEILRFTATPAGYQLLNPITGIVLRETELGHDLSLMMNQSADFYPWGMADATIFNLGSGSANIQINLLPTGIVEVH